MDNIEKALIAERMAETIEERGHCTGYMETDGGRVCLLGAGRVAQGQSNDAAQALVDALSPRFRESVIAISMRQNEADELTADVLGFKTSEQVWQYNDGSRIAGYNGVGIDQEAAIDKCIERAKYWREQG